jgi:hypothetical protein
LETRFLIIHAIAYLLGDRPNIQKKLWHTKNYQTTGRYLRQKKIAMISPITKAIY